MASEKTGFKGPHEAGGECLIALGFGALLIIGFFMNAYGDSVFRPAGLVAGIVAVVIGARLIPKAGAEFDLEKRVRDRLEYFAASHEDIVAQGYDGVFAQGYEGSVLERLVALSNRGADNVSLTDLGWNTESGEGLEEALYILDEYGLVTARTGSTHTLASHIQVRPTGVATLDKWQKTRMERERMEKDRAAEEEAARRQAADREHITIINMGSVGAQQFGKNPSAIVFQGTTQELKSELQAFAQLVTDSNLDVPNKEEIKDNLRELAEQSGRPANERNRATINNAIKGIGTVLTASSAALKDVNLLMETWQKTEGLLRQLLGAG